MDDKKSTKSKPRNRRYNRRKTGGQLRNGLDPLIGEATQFKPGESGNPLGRPKTKLLREYARELAEEIDPVKRKIKARILVEALYDKAKRGNLPHFQEFLRLLEEDTSVRTRMDLDSESAAPMIIDVSAIPTHHEPAN